MSRLAVLFSLLLGPGIARGDDSLLSPLRWRSIGPFRGGRVTSVAGVAGQPLVYYQGATGGGIWKTEDAGHSWQNVSDGYFKTGSVGAVAVAPSDPNVVYAGMGEACIRANFSHGDGVYRSTDAGRTWTHIGLSDTRQIGKIRIHPRDPDWVYVAAVGHATGPNEERGLFRSKDGGKSWEKILYFDDETGAADVALDPSNPRTVYATLWPVLRRPWGVFSGGPHGGIYKSTDGGDRFTKLAEGLPPGDKGRIGVAVSPVDPKRVWATVEAVPEEAGGVFLSEDGGETWRLVNNEMDVRRRPYYYGHIIADTQDLDTVYVLTKPILKSIDGGKSFEEMSVPHGDGHDLWIAPEDNRRMILGDDGGAAVTFDSGRSWSDLLNQPTGQFYWVVTDGQFPYRIYGAQQDNTTVSIPSRTTSAGGIDRTDWYPVGGGESGYIAPDPRDPDVFYAGSFWGLLTRYDRRTRETRNITPWPDSPMGRTGAELQYRFAWTFPILVSPHDPSTLYAAANVVFRSGDEGQVWDVVSPDLTRDDKEKENGDRLTDFYCTIASLAESKVAKGVLWAGSDDGLVHVSRDGAKTWQNVTPPELPEWSRVNIVEPSPHDAGTAYLAANRYLWDDYRPYIFKTSDYGETWKRIDSGLPQSSFVRVVREDGKRKGLLYAGTETGVHVSFDDGLDWQSLKLNLPVVPITDLAVKGDDLVASTQGRAFWILDGLGLVRELPDLALSSSAHLFEPEDPYRLRGGRGRRAVSGVGQNPPAGAIIYYYLKDRPSGDVGIEILDAEGGTIQGLRGPAEPGVNRFEWDLRYPDARGLPERTYLMGGSLRGPVAVPGGYQVRLRVGEEVSTRSFELRKDPRIPTTAEDFQKQFDLLLSIRDRLSAAHDAVATVLDLKEQIDGIEKRAEGRADLSEVSRQASELGRKLQAVLDQLYEPRFIGVDDQLLLFPLKLNARLASLGGVVASADRAPTSAAQEVFRELSSQLDSELVRLQAILSSELPALNRLAQEKGMTLVSSMLRFAPGERGSRR
ncbi:MAG: VPS10 domain-containing protein [Vicinamibacteria bacterium]